MRDPNTDYRRNASVFRAADGRLVVQVALADPVGTPALERLVADARDIGADAIWVHGAEVDPTAVGFESAGGYVTLAAVAPPEPLGLPSPPRESVRDLQRACFSRVWGRREPGALDPAASFVGLHDGVRWVAICEVHVEERGIDCPGVLPLLRSPELSVQLVRGAAALLPQDEEVTLETSGEDEETIAAYRTLGFEVVKSVPGWELTLRT
jgi:ribosomal protein S18 acetylase RimI-like enzyme